MEDFKMIKRTVSLMVCAASLAACTAIPDMRADCTGLTLTQAARYGKKNHLFLVNDPSFYERYSMKTAADRVTLYTNVCTPQDNGIRYISTISHGWGTTRYCYLPEKDSAQMYGIFLDWAKQSPNQRQKTLDDTNKALATFQCGGTTPRSQAAWYADIEQHTQMPVLVSNARDPAIHFSKQNETIALTPLMVQHLHNHILQIGK